VPLGCGEVSRVRIRMANKDTYTIEELSDEDTLELVADLEEGTSKTLTLTMDEDKDTSGIVHLMRAQVSAVEVD